MGSNLNGHSIWVHSLLYNDFSKQEVKDYTTRAIAGTLGGALTGLFAQPDLCAMFLPVTGSKGAFYGSPGIIQFVKQVVGACFVISWNIVVTFVILLVVMIITPLRMLDEQLVMGDDSVHGEVACSSASGPSGDAQDV